jgi:hypothetical protein
LTATISPKFPSGIFTISVILVGDSNGANWAGIGIGRCFLRGELYSGLSGPSMIVSGELLLLIVSGELLILIVSGELLLLIVSGDPLLLASVSV